MAYNNRRYRRTSSAAASGIGCLGILAIVAAVVIIGALLSGLIFFLVWNHFVVVHLAGARHASFGASMLVGLAIGALAGGSSASSSRK